ncbi:MAG TPA: carboxypeptidase-like regulatory domain-containing protein [Candidatus Thermoplasmatota archaeon]|nr:carboxypeptidase-like regulatory domain-containing protein [Candidatus Thermoplasmatota archaeon]
MREPWIAVLVALALAGCSGHLGGPADGEGGPEPASGVGVVGVVVSPAIVPLAGVALRLEPVGLDAATDAEGRFAFDGLREGSYTLQASLPGYVQTTLAVEAGGPLLKVVLEPDPRVGAYFDAYVFDGFVDYSFNVAGARGNSGDGPNFTIGERAPDLIQMELVWDSTQALGENLDLTAIANDGNVTLPDIGHANGPSPLLLVLNSTTIQEGKLGPKVFLDMAIFAGQETVADGRGYGVAASQQYRLVTHMFYGYLPLDGWRFTNDGDPPPAPT